MLVGDGSKPYEHWVGVSPLPDRESWQRVVAEDETFWRIRWPEAA
jgi:hypothetical protein